MTHKKQLLYVHYVILWGNLLHIYATPFEEHLDLSHTATLKFIIIQINVVATVANVANGGAISKS